MSTERHMLDLRLLPAESMALAIARGQASGGAGGITPDIAAFLVLILNRLLADPDVEDPRIAAASGLVQEWTGQSDAASDHADALGAEYSSIRRVALVPPGARAMVWSASRREARTASDHAAELRVVLDGGAS